jgi:hypothetical protein
MKKGTAAIRSQNLQQETWLHLMFSNHAYAYVIINSGTVKIFSILFSKRTAAWAALSDPLPSGSQAYFRTQDMHGSSQQGPMLRF